MVGPDGTAAVGDDVAFWQAMIKAPTTSGWAWEAITGRLLVVGSHRINVLPGNGIPIGIMSGEPGRTVAYSNESRQQHDEPSCDIRKLKTPMTPNAIPAAGRA